jgi:hypothetical protein
MEWKCRIQNASTLSTFSTGMECRIQNASDDFLFPGDLSSICSISLSLSLYIRQFRSSCACAFGSLLSMRRCSRFPSTDVTWLVHVKGTPFPTQAVVCSLRNVTPFRAHANCLFQPFFPQIVGRFTSWVLPSPLHLPLFHQTWFPC